MLEKIKALAERMRDLAEVNALSERDLDDLGLNRDQMRTLITLPPDVGQRMSTMAQVFGVDVADLMADRPAYVDMVRTCSKCRARAECAHELAKGIHAEAENCGFCANAETFDAMAHAQTATAA